MTPPATTEPARTVIVSKAAMMRHHDPERIQGYCRGCEKFGLFWSCPPFESPPLSRLPAWTHALLMTQKTWVDASSTPAALIAQFMASREILSAGMTPAEGDGVVAVIAGHCSGCRVCTRPKGIPCNVPARMRYSLEALGFDITGLAGQLAGETVHWPKSGVPDYLMIVGALLCASHELAQQAQTLINASSDEAGLI